MLSIGRYVFLNRIFACSKCERDCPNYCSWNSGLRSRSASWCDRYLYRAAKWIMAIIEWPCYVYRRLPFDHIFVIGAWTVLPVLSLSVFLIISAWHFGTDANAQNFAERWLFGSLVFCLPALFHPIDVANLYEILSGPLARNIVSITRVWAPISAIIVIFMVYTQLSNRPQRRKDIATILGLITFAWVLPPLVYFAIYFCALHSPTHFCRVIKLIPASDRRRAVMHTIVFTVITLTLAGLSLNMLFGELPVEQSVVQIVFIGLAALTVPHMLLIDGICRSKLG